MAQDPVPGRSMGGFITGAVRLADDHHRIYGWGKIQPWEARGACRDTPIELWFGSDVSVSPGQRRPYRTPEQTRQAKEICASCPVLDECQAWALRSKIPFGVLGGWTERERQRLIYGAANSATGVTSHRRPSRAMGPLHGRTCVVCEAKFEAKRRDQRTCSPACASYWRWQSAKLRRAQRQAEAG
jgi:WhiB family redox-sensing transcriptional regulator